MRKADKQTSLKIIHITERQKYNIFLIIQIFAEIIFNFCKQISSICSVIVIFKNQLFFLLNKIVNPILIPFFTLKTESFNSQKINNTGHT